MDSTIIVAIITGVATVIAAIISGIYAFRKTKGDKTEKPSQQIQVGENIITANGQSAQTINFYSAESQEKKPSEPAIAETKNVISEKEGHGDNTNHPFRVTLGQKHKTLREHHLELTVREMSDFYRLENTSFLESCESGKKELPRACVESLVDFFFVNKDFLDKDETNIFQTIYVFGKKLQNLLDDNFKPFFLVQAKPRNGLYAYPILYKLENGFSRVVTLNLSSFHSNGEGRYNVENIIQEMIKRKIDSYQTSVIQVSQEIWKRLENNSFYCKNPSSLGQVDYDCQDIFSEWYSRLLKSH
ncbi:MAG: hypothetical protein AB1476_06495 [Candidatus Hadarchaeota archaeon]